MSEFGAERSQDDPVEGDLAAEEPTPGEHHAREAGGESEETGVAYDEQGEPVATPHDLAMAEAEQDEEES
jgi:hypothetical protein